MTDFPVVITDEFSRKDGRWFQYGAVPLDQRDQFYRQKHVNIRSFVSDELAAPVTMLFMDLLTMEDLDDKAISTFTSDTSPKAKLVVQENENWTFGATERQADRKNWFGITVECDTSISNLTTTQSVMTNG